MALDWAQVGVMFITTAMYAAVLMLTGIALLTYCIDGAIDPFWSRGTRLLSALGALVGLGCMGFAAIAFVVAT